MFRSLNCAADERELSFRVENLERRFCLSSTPMQTFHDTPGDDHMRISLEPGTPAMLDLRGGGTNYVLITGDTGSQISIWGGSGRDLIKVVGDVQVTAELGNGGDVYHGMHNVGSVVVEGGPGNDRIYGGAGNDVLVGDDGDDLLVGGKGNDVFYGRDGNDRILGGEGNDALNGDAGDDRLNGGSGNDHLEGNSGDDVLRGDSGNDTIYGSAGRDHLIGSSGDDVLFGGADPDVLLGGPGFDIARSFFAEDHSSGIELFAS